MISGHDRATTFITHEPELVAQTWWEIESTFYHIEENDSPIEILKLMGVKLEI